MTNSIGITVSKDAINEALNNIQGAVNNKVVLPILGNVKLDANNNKLTLTCTDMDITVSSTIEASVDIEGSLTIPARKLHDIIKRMPKDADVTIRGAADDKGQVQVKSKGCRFKLPCIKSDEFPILTRGDTDCEFDVETPKLLQLIKTPQVAMSTNEVQYSLNGINLKSIDKAIIATATNGHKLSKVNININNEIANFPDVILPSKTIGILVKILDKAAFDAKVSLSETKIAVSYGNTTLVSKLIDGTFPDAERVFPKELTHKLDINRELIISAISRVSLAADAKDNEVIFNITNGLLTLTAESKENGTGEEDIEVDVDFKELRRKFNSKYLLEILSNMENENVTFYFNDNREPNLIHGNNMDEEVYLLMGVTG